MFPKRKPSHKFGNNNKPFIFNPKYYSLMYFITIYKKVI